MKKFLAAVLISATIMPSAAFADWNNHHRHHNVYRHHNGGGNGDVAGALIGGLIIGGMLGAIANQPTYYQQPQLYYDPYYQPVCNRYFAGRDIYGRPVFQTVCQ